MLTTIDTLAAAFNCLTVEEQFAEWRSFLAALDEGGAGHHRYYLLLLPLWDAGEVPELIDSEFMERLEGEWEAEAMADPLCWAASQPMSIDEYFEFVAELPGLY